MTPDELELRSRVIEQVLGAVQDRWIERKIRWAHEAGEDPVKAARQAAGSMGHYGFGLSWETGPKGIRVRTEPPEVDLEFVIPWRDVAARALDAVKPSQLSLF